MTLEELIAAAADIDRALTDRVHVWRIIVDEQCHELYRIYRGSFYRQRDSHSEPHSQGETK